MTASKDLALDLLSDLTALTQKAGDLNDIQAQSVALVAVTLAINELRQTVKNIGKAADATAGFTADIAAAIKDDSPSYFEDVEEEDDPIIDEAPDYFQQLFGKPLTFGGTFGSTHGLGKDPILRVA